MVRGTGHGGPGPGPHLGPPRRRPGRIPEECRSRRRQVASAGVEGRIVDRAHRIEGFPRPAGTEVERAIGSIVGDEIGPPEIARGAGDVELVEAGRTALGIGLGGIGPHVSPEKATGWSIDAEAEGVAATHGIDLGQGLGIPRWKQIACGDGVGAVGFRVDPQNLSAPVGRVGRGALGIVEFLAGAMVERGEALRAIRIGVVASAQVQMTGGIEGQPPARMVGLGDPRGHPQQDALGGRVQGSVLDGEARETVLEDARRAVIAEDPPVGDKSRMQGQSEQPVFRAGEHVERSDGPQAGFTWMPYGDPAPAFREHHSPIGRHIEGDGFTKPLGQHGGAEPCWRLGLDRCPGWGDLGKGEGQSRDADDDGPSHRPPPGRWDRARWTARCHGGPVRGSVGPRSRRSWHRPPCR